mmetsp:Transcript_9312/g.13218  ORF Transcript_9312/g.13218 Transcript_9312/m.13218 type:complete len:582 (-) Transcript_9312:152-1897(-)
MVFESLARRFRERSLSRGRRGGSRIRRGTNSESESSTLLQTSRDRTNTEGEEINNPSYQTVERSDAISNAGVLRESENLRDRLDSTEQPRNVSIFSMSRDASIFRASSELITDDDSNNLSAHNAASTVLGSGNSRTRRILSRSAIPINSYGDLESADNESQEQQEQERRNGEGRIRDDQTNEQPPEVQVRILTDRLRCLFAILTLPILPLGSLLAILLCHLIYTLFLEFNQSCGKHYLKLYAIISAFVFLYAPNHKKVKLVLFRYSRERDGPNRPRSVRIYDQCFHIICLLYVYWGAMILQACNDDILDTSGQFSTSNANQTDIAFDNIPYVLDKMGNTKDIQSGCAATCPALYSSMKYFVITLEIFAGVLLLPLVSLPCVYVWILRRVRGVDPEMWEETLRRETGEETGFTKTKIMEAMEHVRLVGHMDSNRETSKSIIADLPTSVQKVKVVRCPKEQERFEQVWKNKTPNGNGESQIVVSDEDEFVTESKECCICLEEFDIVDVELGGDCNCSSCNKSLPSSSNSKVILRTKCGHMFHKECIGGWIGGYWGNTDSSSTGNSNWARRKCCPLCRVDLAPK